MAFVFFTMAALLCSAKDSDKRLDSNVLFDQVKSGSRQDTRSQGYKDASIYVENNDVVTGGRQRERRAETRLMEERKERSVDGWSRAYRKEGREMESVNDRKRRSGKPKMLRTRDVKGKLDPLLRRQKDEKNSNKNNNSADATERDIEKERQDLKNSLQKKEGNGANVVKVASDAVLGSKEAKELAAAKSGDFSALSSEANVQRKYIHEQHWRIPATSAASGASAASAASAGSEATAASAASARSAASAAISLTMKLE